MEWCCLSCFPGPWKTAAVGTGGKESHNQVTAGACPMPQAQAVGRGERLLLVLLIKLQLALFPITLFLRNARLHT